MLNLMDGLIDWLARRVVVPTIEDGQLFTKSLLVAFHFLGPQAEGAD